MRENTTPDCKINTSVVAAPGLTEGQEPPFFTCRMECYAADGSLRWADEFRNLVTTAGKNDILDQYFKGSEYTAAWYLGLKGTGSADAADTLASHSGWTEVTDYSGDRPAITWGTASSGTLSGSEISITMTDDATVAGGFFCTVDSGTSGVLYSAGNFANSRGLYSGDTLKVTPQVTMS